MGVTVPVRVRLLQAGELNVLKPYGVDTFPDAATFIAEGDGQEILGAAVVRETPFETEQLNRKSARITSLKSWPQSEDALSLLAEACREWLVSKGVQFTSCRVAADDEQAVSALKKSGFEDVETLLTFACSLPQTTEDAVMDEKALSIAIAAVGDGSECARIAENCFSSDRFHRDAKIDPDAADRLKKTWVENAFKGRADTVFVARNNEGEIVGFNICVVTDEAAVIDLICVRSDARGQGFARALVQGAMSHYAGRYPEMRVGTQSENQASTALYQSCGFQIMSRSKTLHLHEDVKT